MKIIVSIFSIFTLFTSAIAQQTPEQPEIKDNSIKGQFETLYKKSNNYKEFKVVRRTKIIELKNNTIDTLKNLEKKLSDANQVIADLNKQVDNTKKTLDATNQNLTTANNQIESISFLGNDITKKTFKTITGSIFVGLLLLLAFFIYKYKKSNAVTQNSLASLNDLEKEFEDHRRRALEREQMVMRKLQDEINKHK